jgi:hypothetical protein
MTFSMAGPSEVKKAKAYEEIETCQYWSCRRMRSSFLRVRSYLCSKVRCSLFPMYSQGPRSNYHRVPTCSDPRANHWRAHIAHHPLWETRMEPWWRETTRNWTNGRETSLWVCQDSWFISESWSRGDSPPVPGYRGHYTPSTLFSGPDCPIVTGLWIQALDSWWPGLAPCPINIPDWVDLESITEADTVTLSFPKYHRLLQV